jgi:hypothetical protein
MNENNEPSRLHRIGVIALGLAVVLAIVMVGWFLVRQSDLATHTDTAAQIHNLCAACHSFPPPASLPRPAWKREIEQGYQFARESRADLFLPPIADVIDYYESRAPDQLVLPEIRLATTPLSVGFTALGDGAGPKDFAVANVNVVRLFNKHRPEILACDMHDNVVKLLRPYESTSQWQVLAQLPHPVHTEVVDLDGDGIPDILVACLGEFLPTDRECGRVVWLRGNKSGDFTPITLLEGVGRVADVRAVDFNGDGKLDLVVAVFGWRHVGNILVLENRTTDWDRPVFVRHLIDPRHGTIHVPVADLNGDGKPDFVALISQEHETIVAFINEGDFRFRKEVIYTAAHPAYGSSGIELVDLDGDGDLDVLYTNGDSMDNNLIRPEHGVQWLENRGSFPFVHHPLAPLFGAHRAVAADFDGDGDLDIVAVSFLPQRVFPQQKDLDSIILLEQTAPGEFVRHSLQRGACDHPTCAAGDLFGSGRIDFVTGNFALFTNVADSIKLWRNQGRGSAWLRPRRLGWPPTDG